MSIAQLRDTVVKFGSADLRKEEISALEKIHLQDIARYVN